MIKQISIKTKFGWISAFEQNNKIYKVKFGKCKNKSTSNNLKKFKSSLNNFFSKRNKFLKFNILIVANPIQKKELMLNGKHLKFAGESQQESIFVIG